MTANMKKPHIKLKAKRSYNMQPDIFNWRQWSNWYDKVFMKHIKLQQEQLCTTKVI